MATTRVVQKVRPGLSEYYTSFTALGIGDKLIMGFKSELTINDLLVKVGSGASLTYKISLFYPSSKITAKLADSQNGDWILNPIGTGGAMWHRLPASSAIELEIQTLTTGAELDLLVVGR